jgi:hypothetical protein
LAQFEDNLGALDVVFDGDQIARLDAASRVEMGFPHEMLNGAVLGMAFGGVTVERRG